MLMQHDGPTLTTAAFLYNLISREKQESLCPHPAVVLKFAAAALATKKS
jgi:hypothetical protein